MPVTIWLKVSIIEVEMVTFYFDSFDTNM